MFHTLYRLHKNTFAAVYKLNPERSSFSACFGFFVILALGIPSCWLVLGIPIYSFNLGIFFCLFLLLSWLLLPCAFPLTDQLASQYFWIDGAPAYLGRGPSTSKPLGPSGEGVLFLLFALRRCFVKKYIRKPNCKLMFSWGSLTSLTLLLKGQLHYFFYMIPVNI